MNFLPVTPVSGLYRLQECPPLVFPVVKGADWSDSFGAPRSGHTHQGQDLMASKMRPLVACFDGTVRIQRSHGSAGNWITLRSDSGWRAEYMHLNNDTPGTNDGKGGDTYAFAPGLKDGTRVKAGQFLGYVGDSGNAEGGASHCHFELHSPKGVINAAAPLRGARILAEPQIGVALAMPKSGGVLKLTGVVLASFPDQREAIVKVTQLTEPGGTPTTLNPPRAKRILLGELASQPKLNKGEIIAAEGKDLGRAHPMRVQKIRISGIETTTPPEDPTPDPETLPTKEAPPVKEPSAPEKPAPASLPERWTLDGFERGLFVSWRLEGDCWGRAPEDSSYGRNRFRGWAGRFYLSTAHPRLGSDRPESGRGTARSPEFGITYNKLGFLIGGGNYPGDCCLNLIIDGKVVRTATGNGSDHLERVEWDIAEFVGQKGHLEILDKQAFGTRAYLLLDELEMLGLPPTKAPEPEPEPTVPVQLETPAPPEPKPVTISKQKGLPKSTDTTMISSEVVGPQASVTLPDGTKVEGKRLLTLEATGYGPGENGSWGDRTALGTKVGYGTVAVDPKIIPLRSRLWVDGYGFCIALDVGGAIKGNRIDLAFNDDVTANQYGRKSIRVLVIEEPSK